MRKSSDFTLTVRPPPKAEWGPRKPIPDKMEVMPLTAEEIDIRLRFVGKEPVRSSWPVEWYESARALA